MAHDFIDFLPLFAENAATVRDRMDSDANAGLAPTDERSVDTREGGFYYDVTQVMVLEAARMWDALGSEVPASANPATAWGEYLDRHAEVFGLARKAATAAEGEAAFAADAGGVAVAMGTQVSAPQVDVGQQPPVFETTAMGVTAPPLVPPATPTAVPSTTGGALPVATFFYAVTAVNAFGETTASAAVSATTTVAGTSKITLDWPDVAGAIAYRVYRGASAAALTLLTEVAAVNFVPPSTYVDLGAVTPGPAGAPLSNVTAGIVLAIRALAAGAVGNIGTGALTILVTPVAGVVSTTNSETLGGSDPESDEELGGRIVAQYRPQGAGSSADYRRWALAYPGVGRVSVTPLVNGPGTVGVVISTETGGTVAQSVVDGLQALLDPVPGQGAGLAPIGAIVTVTTPVPVLVPVTATLTLEPGFTLDGDSGSNPVRAAALAALARYFDSLVVGEDVVRNHIEAVLFVDGVFDVAVSAPAGATVVIATTPPQIAMLGVVTLS